LQLSIIIVTYNVKYFLEQCLYSVQMAVKGIEAEVFVIDNHSTDGTKEYLSKKFPGVIFRWNNTNDGFGKASNSVLKQAKGQFILFLNPDTIVPEACFKKCISFFKTKVSCGALGVRMLDGSGRYLKESKRGFPSPLTAFFKITGLSALFSSSKLFARYYQGHLPEKENNEVDVLSGAFMMLSKKAIDATGGFDENFFMYGEDVDLSYRIKQAGMANYYFAGTTIIHFKGESTQKLSPDYIRNFYGAMWLFVKKHYSHKSVTLFFMRLAISANKAIGSLKMKIFTKENTREPALANTAVLAGHERFNEMLHLIKYASPPVLLSGRIATQNNDQGAAIGKISDLKNCLKQNKTGQLLFCEGEDLSFEKIIEEAGDISGKINFLFHAKGSNAIVGSSNKNAPGIIITKP
jgi:GT2 family glycosyltransferase